jgi:hypothetical protein
MEINPNEYKVLKFTNIADFDFTSAMGCMFNGNPDFIKAGESKLLPFAIGDIYATNLAKQIFLRRYESSGSSAKGHSEPVRAIMSDDDINAIKAQIITEAYAEEKPRVMSKEDAMFARVAELNKVSEEPISPKGYMDKGEVMAELEKRGIKFDARQSKANLEKLLV